MDGKIYKITNTINGKSYIGQTVGTLENRFRSHKQGTRQPKNKMTKLQQAMEQYGKLHFTIELIEDGIDNIKDLCSQEKYYIRKYNTQDEYNSTSGGESNKDRTRIDKCYIPKNICDLMPKSLTLTEAKFFILIMSEFCNKNYSIQYNYIKMKLNIKLGPQTINKIVKSLYSKSPDSFNSLSFDVNNYTLNYKISNELELKKPVKIDFEDLINLENYSKRLYLILNDNKYTKNLKLEIGELEHKLGIPLSYRNSAKEMNAKILKPAMDNIKEFFPKLKLKTTRTGKRITHYEFTY